MELSIETTEDEAGRCVVTATGAIDMQSRHALIGAGEACLADDTGRALVLDLSQISFIDSTGIGALVELSRAAEEAKRDFVIREPSARVVRILQLTGLYEAWTVEPAPA
jgi:anti-sigma B factor antagonist